MKLQSIKELADEYGVKNLRVFIPMKAATSLMAFGIPMGMTCSDGPDFDVECEIIEDRYRVSDGYQVQFQPINLGDGQPYYFAKESFYQSDFNSMRERNPDTYRIYVLVDEDNKYQKLD